MEYLKKGLRLTVILILICGLIYPLSVTAIGQVLFPHQANGSIIKSNGKEVGSDLIGQSYNDDKHFVGRVSAVEYNVVADGEKVEATSGSSNLSSTSPELKKRAENDIEEFLEKNPEVSKDEISEELISQSASGLDPDITPKGAKIQVPRVSKATGISEEELNKLIDENIEQRLIGIYGEPRVNVLKLNVAVDNYEH